MDNQKDTQKTEINLYGQQNVRDIKLLSNISNYEFINKRTEKLVTALYMVSDCMDTDDALKNRIRLLGVELLSDIYKISSSSSVNKNTQIIISINRANEILSFIEVAYNIGFISEMNTVILKNEFSKLISDLNQQKTKDKNFAFTLDEKMFNLPEQKNIDSNNSGNFDFIGQNFIKDKKTSFNKMSFENNKSPINIGQTKRTNIESHNMSNREDRKEKIIIMIKNLSRDKAHKKDLSNGQSGVSIRDISLAFTDCSEKTIQRELNTLVLNGKLKKTGAKRWSRYSLVLESPIS